MSKFLIEPKCASGLVLDVDGAKTESETNIHLWKLGEGIHQFFEFVDAGDGYFYIEACHCRDKVIDVKAGEVGNCINIQLYKKNGTNAQKFKKVYVEEGYYMFLSKLNENFCIDVANGSNDNGTNIWLYSKNDTDAQKFKLINSLDAAIIYAKKYSNERNIKYNYYEGANCANFCSQCLVAGDVPMSNKWKNEAPAFINIKKLTEYFCSIGIILKYWPDINDISRGDIIFCGNFWNKLAHAMFVIGKEGDNVKICANTNNRCDVPFPIKEVRAVLKTSWLLN